MIPPSNPEKPPLERAQRSLQVDMSPAAIDRRLREVSALWELARYLRRFRPADPVETPPPPEKPA